MAAVLLTRDVNFGDVNDYLLQMSTQSEPAGSRRAVQGHLVRLPARASGRPPLRTLHLT